MRLFGKVAEFSAAFALFVLVVVTIGAVFMRYFIGQPLQWTEEMSGMLLTYSSNFFMFLHTFLFFNELYLFFCYFNLFLDKIFDDLASGNNADKYISVIDHRYKVLHLCLSQQFFHVGIDTYRPDLATLYDIPHGQLFQTLHGNSIQLTVVVQDIPQKISLTDYAHIPVLGIDHRYRCVTVAFHLLQPLSDSHIVPKKSNLLLRGQKRCNIHNVPPACSFVSVNFDP